MGSSLNRISQKMLTTPVVVILGCTGTGKSKLAIELAKRFNGEIISADSMQVYKGLDIVTNKVTVEEQEGITHHLINCVDPLSRYTVVDFRNAALPVINKLLRQNKVPIIVGGTNYYIESVLWKVLINPEEKKIKERKIMFEAGKFDDVLCGDMFSCNPEFSTKLTEKQVEYIPNWNLHSMLKNVDPDMADAVHPHDRRKIIRSLQVYRQNGSTHSELLSEQRGQEGGSSLGGPLRYKKSIMLWLQCSKDVLEQRLDERVDEMIEKGLIQELLDFHKHYNRNNRGYYEEGIFQSIGFKEFHEYLTLPEYDRDLASADKILEKGIEDMKVVTKQYAKKQNKWITNRFLSKPDRETPPIYGLDATNIEMWNGNVLRPAFEIIQSTLMNRTSIQNPLPIIEAPRDIHKTYHCEICERIFVGKKVYEIHLNSKKHNKVKASLKKRNNEVKK